MSSLNKSYSDEFNSENDERRQIATILVAIVSLTLLDISVDWIEGVALLHIIIEAIIIPLAAYGVLLVWKGIVRAHEHNRVLKVNLDQVAAEAATWKADAARHLAGLSEAIDVQLTRWGLSHAEKEIALLVLKGLSYKEIADIRSTSERTVRQQTLGIYEKSGLNGRAQLSAFFLEDLLVVSKE